MGVLPEAVSSRRAGIAHWRQRKCGVVGKSALLAMTEYTLVCVVEKFPMVFIFS